VLQAERGFVPVSSSFMEAKEARRTRLRDLDRLLELADELRE
jgi:hypothetical protein